MTQHHPIPTLAEAGRLLGLGDGPPPTIGVPEAGRILGLGRNASYEAAARGDIPTIRVGRLMRAPVVQLAMRLLPTGE